MVRFVQNPNHPKRHEIIAELNYSLAPELWNQIVESKFQGRTDGSVAANVEAMSLAAEVRISVRSRIPDVGRLHVNTKVERINVMRGIWMIIDQLTYTDRLNTGNAYTYIIDQDEVKIMPLPDAITWWVSQAEALSSRR